MNSIERNICEAIDIIVQKAVSEAKYDKTIQGIIVSCIDPTIGKYKVKYQDSSFYAYSGGSDVTYPDGASVYILVPGNDMSKDKTILGTTKKLGINYVVTTEGDEAYDVNGANCIKDSGTFGLCSYRKNYAKVLYSKDSSSNLINVDKTAVEQYIKESGTIICGATFRTDLSIEQQYRGNYGIIFALDFRDNSTGDIVTKYYVVDVDKMVGNPYKLVYAERQYGIFDIDNTSFVEINYISIFNKDFPNTKPESECVDDIFVSNIELCGAIRLSDSDISNYSLSLITPQGTYFDDISLSSDTITIQAQVRVKGKVVDNQSQSIDYYWFIEHVGITSQSLYYNKYGGQGWKCLNNYNIIQDATANTPAVVSWVPGSYQLTVKKSDIVAKEVKYKCVAVYDKSVINKTVVIKNLSSNYDITIESDSGDQFYFDIGFPTLTCLINGRESISSSYTYAWAVINNNGSFETIAETPDINNQYADIYWQYEDLLEDIKNESVLVASTEERLNNLKAQLDAYDKITRVDKNKIYHLNVNTITSFSTYQCTVYYNDTYLGTASIVIKNTLNAEGVYNLVINDGTQVYKYDPSGIGATSSALEDPVPIKALTFSVYDNLGNKIDDDIIEHCEIKWTIPTENTLLKVPSSYTPSSVDLINNTATYSNLMSFTYLIEDKYDITKKNNDITLEVVYKGMHLMAKTDLTFVKEGESGTNGTEFVCKIVPNVRDGADAPDYPIVTQIGSSSSWSVNYVPAQTNVLFRVQLWHNENKILDNVSSGTSTEGKTASISWSILKNKYTSSISDYTSFDVNTTSGRFTFNGYDEYNCPANIVKVTVEYDGITYYATMPIVTVKIFSSDYRVKVKEGSGFKYAIYTSDGRSPQYDNVNPFEVVVTRTIGGVEEDVTKKETYQYRMSYSWYYLGAIYRDRQWEDDIHLADRRVNDLEPYQKAVKPLDNFDGFCVTNAIECYIRKYSTSSVVAKIHIPVHLLLNKYGHAELNGWDGNSISIDEEGGVVLSPQIGAGIKDSNNCFTGALMGKVKEAGKNNIEIGLFGYNAGERTFKLSAEDGSAAFGRSNGGQIIIDPSQGKALLYGGNYSESEKTGLMIDLTTPEIRYGSGAFVVDKNGYLTVKEGGSIAGWNIDDDSLFTGNKTSSSNTRLSSADFSRTINNTERDNLRIALGNKFAVAKDGTMYASDAVIKGEVHATKGYIGNETTGWIIESNNIRNGKTSSTDEENKGIYLGTSRIAFGVNDAYSYFNSDGTFSLAGDKIKFNNRVLSLENVSLNWENTKIKSDGTTLESQFQIAADEIQSTVSKTYETKVDASNKLDEAKDYTDDELKAYSTTVEMQSEIKQSAESIKSTVSATYETKIDASSKLTSANNYTDNKLSNYPTTVEMQSAITQTANEINTEVKKKIGADEIISTINQSAEAVKIKASKISLEGLVTINSTFQINNNGDMTATGGTIGGFTIDTSRLYAGSSSQGFAAIQAGTTSSAGAFMAGGTNINNWSDAPFRVSMAGHLRATNAEINGSIESSTTDAYGRESIVRIKNGRVTFIEENGTSNDWTGYIRMYGSSLQLHGSVIDLDTNKLEIGNSTAISGMVTFGSGQSKFLIFQNGICVGGSLS